MKRYNKFINESYIDEKGELKDFNPNFTTTNGEIEFDYEKTEEDSATINHYGTILYKDKEYYGFISHGKMTDRIYWCFMKDVEIFDPEDSYYDMEKLAEEIIIELG
jgi:hypothetical protein